MIHLRTHSEYSFRRAYGRLDAVLDVATSDGQRYVALTDRTTFGHVAFRDACAKREITPIFGVEIAVVTDARERKKQHQAMMGFLARNDEGLKELYQLNSVSNSAECFYYNPRVDYRDINALTENVIILSGSECNVERVKFRPNFYLELRPSNPAWNKLVVERFPKYQRVVTCNNLYPRVDDRAAYEILAGDMRDGRTTMMHLASEDELRLAIPEATDDDFLNTERIALGCTATLGRASMVTVEDDLSLRERCEIGGIKRGLAAGIEENRAIWMDDRYKARLDHELEVIEGKNFANYFRLVSRTVQWAKERMFVGPARGSAAGSLVSYLLEITDVDPLEHDLLFERFIDINRSDYPDIDVDFADDKREQVFDYLRTTYGNDRVVRVGNILRYKPRSALNDVVRALNLSASDIDQLKDVVESRFAGDERATECIADALNTTDVGRAITEKYPSIWVAALLEGHATTTGTHAGGVVVTDAPVSQFCSVGKDGVAQVDKKDAETLGMVKIDILGLSMLGVIGDCLEQIGKPREWLVNYPRDDAKVFALLNDDRMTGVFQFEGGTQRRLAASMGVEHFRDIEALNALSRPGPLASGTTDEYIRRRLGLAPIEYLHPTLEPICNETYGCVIYQEQFMRVCREIGDMSWADIGKLRKGMALKLGQDAFNKYYELFCAGALTRMSESDARLLWDRLITFGAYGFNKSHATAYAYVAYWCAVLKTYYPLNFGAALLKKADPTQGTNILRELVREGFEYVPIDVEKSDVQWSVVDGKLLGGLTNIKGIGEKSAIDIIARRKSGRPLMPGQIAKLASAVTPYDDLFQCERLFGDMYKNPGSYKITSKLSMINEITEIGEYVFIGKIIEKRVRNLNEPELLERRKGRVIKRHNFWLDLVVADDTGERKVKIGTRDFEKFQLKHKIVDDDNIGKFFMWRARWRDEKWPALDVTRLRPL